MEFNKEEIEIIKSVIESYNTFKNDIDKKINNGYLMEDLLKYVESMNNCYTTNIKLEEDLKYIDIGFDYMTISIYQHNDEIYLGDTIEVWFCKNSMCYLIGVFNCVRELELAVKEFEEK